MLQEIILSIWRISIAEIGKVDILVLKLRVMVSKPEVCRFYLLLSMFRLATVKCPYNFRYMYLPQLTYVEDYRGKGHPLAFSGRFFFFWGGGPHFSQGQLWKRAVPLSFIAVGKAVIENKKLPLRLMITLYTPITYIDTFTYDMDIEVDNFHWTAYWVVFDNGPQAAQLWGY